MTALKIKYLKGAFTVFALCLIGTVSAAPNGNGEEKEKEVKETTTTLQSNFLVNKESSFEPRDTADPNNNCVTEETQHCVYQLTPEGMSNIPDQPSYSPAEIAQFEADGWIEPHPDSSPGLYTN
ncbi:hypothetical protein [Sphingobacterium sp. SGR-19]|uniref:hypothetical protein n=1 Tax=Sphingobacterium sp. SGR-19 TaxID=2710886 RepID=UPI0013EC4CC6|nr:hypothetical protein [Sphingobacterium sp. SGR-19]NGM67325.1 hypothetical protein [Sphingobacterium sp. SGR-19]